MGPIILAAQLQNPFGFDRLDLDVALLGMRLHKELCSISHACAFSDIQSFTKLTFLGLHKRLELDASDACRTTGLFAAGTGWRHRGLVEALAPLVLGIDMNRKGMHALLEFFGH